MNRAILVFVVTAYALSIGLSLVVGLTGGHNSQFAGLGLISTFFPANLPLAQRRISPFASAGESGFDIGFSSLSTGPVEPLLED